MLSTAPMTEERNAASGTGALALGRPAATASFMQPTVQLNANDRGYVCASDLGTAHRISPVTKAWAARPLIPDGGGGG